MANCIAPWLSVMWTLVRQEKTTNRKTILSIICSLLCDIISNVYDLMSRVDTKYTDTDTEEVTTIPPFLLVQVSVTVAWQTSLERVFWSRLSSMNQVQPWQADFLDSSSQRSACLWACITRPAKTKDCVYLSAFRKLLLAGWTSGNKHKWQYKVACILVVQL